MLTSAEWSGYSPVAHYTAIGDTIARYSPVAWCPSEGSLNFDTPSFFPRLAAIKRFWGDNAIPRDTWKNNGRYGIAKPYSGGRAVGPLFIWSFALFQPKRNPGSYKPQPTSKSNHLQRQWTGITFTQSLLFVWSWLYPTRKTLKTVPNPKAAQTCRKHKDSKSHGRTPPLPKQRIMFSPIFLNFCSAERFWGIENFVLGISAVSSVISSKNWQKPGFWLNLGRFFLFLDLGGDFVKDVWNFGIPEFWAFLMNEFLFLEFLEFLQFRAFLLESLTGARVLVQFGQFTLFWTFGGGVRPGLAFLDVLGLFAKQYCIKFSTQTLDVTSELPTLTFNSNP